MIALTLAACLLPATASAEQESGDSDPGSLVLVVDASGSMAEPDGRGSTRMEAAKASLNRVIDELPEKARVGLRAYGAQIADGAGSCEDSNVLAPVELLDREALRSGVAALQPLGNTPIAYALEQAANDLPDEGPRSIVLVSDGEENCNVDPCEIAGRIVERGIDLRIDTIGLQVDSKARGQLSCIASAGGGTYYDVEDIGALPNTLERLSVRAARGYEAAGRPIVGGETVADAAPISDGHWLDTIGETAAKTYGLPEVDDGSLSVSATIRPMMESVTQRERIALTVLDADGHECVSEVRETAIGAFTRNTPVTATTILTAEDLGNCGDAPVLSVTAPDAEESKALELLVVEEPAVTDLEALPKGSTSYDLPELPAAGSSAQPIAGTPSFSGAPTLEPGVTYADTILTGEALFYRVPVDWGQQGVCEATFEQSGAVASGLRGPSLSVSVDAYGSNRGAFGSVDTSASSGDYDGTQAVTVRTATPEVAYRNRELVGDVANASLAGDYYCAVFVNRSARDAEETGEIPIRVRAEAVGDVAGEPDYAEPPAAENAGDEASDDAAAGGSTWWWVLGAVVVVAAAAGGLLWTRRRKDTGAGQSAV
ncbi:VWA domain-containing protein [uncultured Aeromicrobium sp.]|uniref:vWA domain-containing protein n=1 Tax=uncultured Aeromicrobium sp. TaxID=337820 RepID=UPI0025FCF708|nr:VWA domain-containing protein [uncultured Aeromicrobium sp.]